MKILRVNRKLLHVRMTNIKKVHEKNFVYLGFALRLPPGDLVEFENDEDDVVINLKTKSNELQNSCQLFVGVCKVNMEKLISEEVCSVCPISNFIIMKIYVLLNISLVHVTYTKTNIFVVKMDILS